MNSNSLTTGIHYDIINNILSCDVAITNSSTSYNEATTNSNNNSTSTTLIDICLDKVKAYEAALSSNANETELIRFSRHISLEAYFENIHSNNKSESINPDANNDNTIDINNVKQTIDNNTEASNDNTSAILAELSSIASNNTESDDTVLILQLSSTVDNLLKELSASDRKIYLYRYFFACSIEAIANITGTQTHSIERTLASCNNKLKALIKESNLICDNKSLLLSLTDIDDSYLLSLINASSKKENGKNTIDNENSISLKETRKLSLPKCLNYIFAAIIIALAILNIAQYTGKNPSDNTEETSDSRVTINKNDYIIDSVQININGEKGVDFEKLMEYATYSDGYEQPFTYNSGYFSGEYNPMSLPDEFPLRDCIGTEIPELADEFKSFYRFKGSDNMQYIIRKFDEEYTLYYLSYVTLTSDDLLINPDFTITYGEVLSSFYGANESEDIKEISIQLSNTDTGYADSLTKKVIYYEHDVASVFTLIQNSSYNSGLLDDYCALYGLSKQFVFDNSVLIVLHLKDGSSSDRLLYYPMGNWFYDAVTEMIFVPDIDSKNSYLNEMLRFNDQKEEPSDPENWKFGISCVGIEPEFITILIQPQDTHVGNGLYLGSEYTVEKLENDIWVTPPSGDFTVTHPFVAYDQNIGSGVMTSFPIQEKYATLEPGTYRLTLTVYDSHSKDLYNPNHKDFYVQFTIEE